MHAELIGKEIDGIANKKLIHVIPAHKDTVFVDFSPSGRASMMKASKHARPQTE
jgi:hypothetical protein